MTSEPDPPVPPLHPVPAESAPTPLRPPKPLAAPEIVMQAIGEPMRWKILRELSDGSHPAVMTLAKRLGCHPDQMGRHLRRLSRAGLVRRVRPEGADKRSRYYEIHSAYRHTLPDGRREIDYGILSLRFGDA